MIGLAEQSELDHAAVWGALRDFIGRLSRPGDLDTVLVDSLDALIDIFGADRGMILCTTADGTPYAVEPHLEPGESEHPVDGKAEVDDLCVDSRPGMTDRLGAELMELPVPPRLRPVVPEHRPLIPEFRDAARPVEPVLDK